MDTVLDVGLDMGLDVDLSQIDLVVFSVFMLGESKSVDGLMDFEIVVMVVDGVG